MIATFAYSRSTTGNKTTAEDDGGLEEPGLDEFRSMPSFDAMVEGGAGFRPLRFHVTNWGSKIDLKISVYHVYATSTGCGLHHKETEYDGVVVYFNYITLSERTEISQSLLEPE